MNNKILLFFSSLIGSNSISAQIITAGTISSIAGSVNNSTISINYSVGEVAIKTISFFMDWSNLYRKNKGFNLVIY